MVSNKVQNAGSREFCKQQIGIINNHNRVLQQLTTGMFQFLSSVPGSAQSTSLPCTTMGRPWLIVDSLHAALLLLAYLRACWLLQEPQPLLLLLPICLLLLLLEEEPSWHQPHPQLLLKQALL